jgi:hypothetical protein
MRKYNFLSLILLVFFFLYATNVFAFKEGKKPNKTNKKSIAKVSTDPEQSVVDINNITSWVKNDGFHDWVVASSWNGSFPRGDAAGVIFAEGIVWGGQVNDGVSPTVRVNGSTYGTGNSPITRLFRVRPDYTTADLTVDAANFFNKATGAVTDADKQTLYDQYAKDWNEWPADQGAPYEDVNGDGKYDPTVDVPGIPGASQTLFIMYDDALSSTLYGSIPIGLQVQETYWAYSYTGALGNVIYKKVDMVYKGTATTSPNATIDSMYIVQWADPDVGNSSDDFAGCDTTLGLGYAYNATSNDNIYTSLGLAPAAVGYDFLQGVSKYTGNPSDSAIFNLKWKKGYKYVNPKPMSSFIYFAAGGNWEDPDFDYQGTLQFYNLMRGYLPRPPYPSSSPFPAGVADVTPFGTYLLDGDPVAGTGKIDGNQAAGGDVAGDRRIMVVNGPISLKLGDTAEVVVALIGGLGTAGANGNLSSVAALKNNDDVAQKVYDLLFQLPSLPPPNVQIAQLDKKLVLNWGNDPISVSKIENFSNQGYSFEGYDVYQLKSPSSSINDPSSAVRIASFDLADGIQAVYDTTQNSYGDKIPVLVAAGVDNGIQRFWTVTKDAFKNSPLIDGQAYYFAVVPYAVNLTPELLPFHVIQSAVVVNTVVPQTSAPGVRYPNASGDTLKAMHTAGTGNGKVLPIVIDPTVTNGHTYLVTFQTDAQQNTTWNLTDKTLNKVIASGLTNQSGDNTYPIADGVLVKVIGPPPGMNTYSIPSGVRDWTFANANSFGLEGFSGAIGMAYNQWFSSSTVLPTQLHKVLIKFASIDSAYNIIDPTDPNVSSAYRYLRKANAAPADPLFAPFIVNPGPGYAYQDRRPAPFAAYDVDNNNQRLDVGFLENNVVGGRVDGKYDPPSNNDGIDNVATTREWFFIFATNYSTSDNSELTKDILNETLPIEWWGTPNMRGTNLFKSGDSFEIIPNYVNSPADVFTYTTAKVDTNIALAKDDISKVNVFPNPYYGYQYRELSRDAKYVTFSHLPSVATIRIFDLAGVLVKTIQKNDQTQFTTWNLQNDHNYPVASGVYVVYIDMPGLGTKILKLAIVQEQQILKVY